MWTARCEELNNGSGLRYFVECDKKTVAFSDVLQGWQNDAMFRALFNAWLAESPYSAFRWETPPVTFDTLKQPFEFVLLDSPWLSCRPDTEAFAEYFQQSPEQDVLVFPNLGGDALMVVPGPMTRISAYTHLAAFVREAPGGQQDQLWRVVGQAMTRRVNTTKPVWLSTAGGGVSWLHVRLDDRPKYYAYGPYRNLR